MTGSASAGSHVQSLARGIAVLEAVAGSPVPMSCKEVAEMCGLDRTITHRLLRTLESEGLVTGADGRYALGGRTLLFGNAYRDHLKLRRIALPYLLSLLHNGLSRYSVSTMSLFIQVGRHVTLVERLWPSGAPIDALLVVGSRLPVETTAAGRCLLAYQPPEQVAALIGEEAASGLRARFDEIREGDGIDFARDDEPHGLPGLAALTAVIRDPSGNNAAALSVSGLGLDAQIGRQSELAKHVRRTADQIGQAM